MSTDVIILRIRTVSAEDCVVAQQDGTPLFHLRMLNAFEVPALREFQLFTQP